jgi:hypothetical protein
VKKRYLLAAALAALVAWPIVYIEGGCSGSEPALSGYTPLLANAKDQRPEARSLLTYPEWHIVYSAESFARHLETKPPSAYSYTGDIGSFWSSFCALHQVADPAQLGNAKVMLYTIGISFSAELGIKALYENTIGRLFEWIGGWRGPDDKFAQRTQQAYGAFMHEVPWYQFPFGKALGDLWQVDGTGIRGAERKVALSLEYGVKAGYAKLIGWASGTALGADETTMRIVLDAPPEKVLAVDARLKSLGNGVYDSPRYSQFTQIASKIAAANIEFREIAGNDDIFITELAPADSKGMAAPFLVVPLADQPGKVRRGYWIKVRNLSATLRSLPAGGATLEHVYDY